MWMHYELHFGTKLIPEWQFEQFLLPFPLEYTDKSASFLVDWCCRIKQSFHPRLWICLFTLNEPYHVWSRATSIRVSDKFSHGYVAGNLFVYRCVGVNLYLPPTECMLGWSDLMYMASLPLDLPTRPVVFHKSELHQSLLVCPQSATQLLKLFSFREPFWRFADFKRGN